MHWFRRRKVRRFFAAMLALAVLSFSFEPLIADVHDGDAPTAELTRSPGAPSHTVGGALVQVAAWSETGTHQADHPAARTSTRPCDLSHAQDHGAPGDAPATSHAVHICHGAHEHAAATPSLPHVVEVATAAVDEATRSMHLSRALSRATEPPVRPPIA